MFPVEQRWRPFEETREHDLNDALTVKNTLRHGTSMQDYILTQPDDSKGNVNNGSVWRRANTRVSNTETTTNQTDLFGSFQALGFKNTYSTGLEFTGEETRVSSYTISPNTNPTCTVAKGSLGGQCTSLSNPNPDDPWNGAISRNYAGTTTQGKTRALYVFDTLELGMIAAARGYGISMGDLLMVAKNNYYWTEKQKEMDFIANGETAVVRRVRRTRELYGFRFADVTLEFPDYDNFELEANLLLDTLHSDAPALPKADNDRLFYTVLEDYADITVKRERMKKMKADPYYNALQVKYAYAVTCHKAQGGQWKNVFLDQGYMTDEYLTPDYFRWLYTAFTRATGTLYLVNYPKEQIC